MWLNEVCYLSFLKFRIKDELTNELGNTITFADFEGILAVVKHDHSNISPVISINDTSCITIEIQL